jgi:hypothetical protein
MRTVYVGFLLLLVAGCATTAATPVVDTASQDVKFEVALQDAIKSQHNIEMSALEQQAAVLQRIEEAVTQIAANQPNTDSGGGDEFDPDPDDGATPVSDNWKDRWPEGRRIVYFYGDPCTHCVKQSTVIDDLEAAGIPCRKICAWYPNPNKPGGVIYTEEGTKYKVKTAPQVWICDKQYALKKFVGFVTAETIVTAAAATKTDNLTEASGPEEALMMLGDGEQSQAITADVIEPSMSSSRVIYSSPSVSVDAGPVSVQVVRGSGPRWNWNGDWSPSTQTMVSHLKNAHGIDAAGMSVSDMQALHDNAHNGVSQSYASVSVQSPTTYYTSQPTRTYRSQPTRYYRSSSWSIPGPFQVLGSVFSGGSCPGGNCP